MAALEYRATSESILDLLWQLTSAASTDPGIDGQTKRDLRRIADELGIVLSDLPKSPEHKENTTNG